MTENPTDEMERVSKHYAELMAAFVGIRPEHGVNNFVIQGPSADQPVVFDMLIGLYPGPGINKLPEMPIVSLGGNTIGMVESHNKILGLTIPQRVKDQKTLVDPEVESMFKNIFIRAKLPYAVLSIGKTKATDEEVVMLSYLYGADPEKVLAEFQTKSKERLRSIN